jgi:hypothetical protein
MTTINYRNLYFVATIVATTEAAKIIIVFSSSKKYSRSSSTFKKPLRRAVFLYIFIGLNSRLICLNLS